MKVNINFLLLEYRKSKFKTSLGQAHFQLNSGKVNDRWKKKKYTTKDEVQNTAETMSFQHFLPHIMQFVVVEATKTEINNKT